MKYDSLFDVVGHIMVGPSSSHTAGACRIGYIAQKLFGKTPEEVVIYLHGSFAETGRGHGTDKAILAGLLGIPPDDERLRESIKLAEEQGLKYRFEIKDLGSDHHPNSVLLELKTESPKLDRLSLIGVSIGGGNIIIEEIDGLEAGFNGNMPTLVIINLDKVGVIARITDIISKHKMNISSMRVSRNLITKSALSWLELNSNIKPELINELEKIPDIVKVRALNQ
jgi:L-serine dehydratase